MFFVFWEKPKGKECTRDVHQKTDCQAVRGKTERRSPASKTKGRESFCLWWTGTHAHRKTSAESLLVNSRNGEVSVLTKMKRMSLPGEAFISSKRSLFSTSPFQSPRCKVWRAYSRLPNGLIRKQQSDLCRRQFNRSARSSTRINSIRRAN